jgi:hypothetical protein
MIEVELPDGRVVEVDTTDSNVAAQAAQKFLSAKAPEQPSMLADAGKSVASGLGRATIGAIGGLGDIRDLASRGVDALGGKLGVDLSPVKSAASVASNVIPGLGLLRNAPTSQDVRSTVTDPIVSPDYQPQSVVGSYLKTGAEFAPGMLTGGRGNLGSTFLRNVVAPAALSETAGQITQGTSAEPYARVAGALAGASGATAAAQKFREMVAARSAAKAVPSAEDTLKTARGQFKAAEDMNVVVAPDWATSAAAKMRADLKGFDPEAQSAVFKAADRLEGLGKPTTTTLTPAQKLQAEMNWEPLPLKPAAQPVAMNDVELVRKQLTALKADTNPSIREAARRAISSLQDSQLALSPAQTLRGNASAYTQVTRDAIGNYAAGKRSNTVMGKAALGDLNAATAGSGANEDNALRQAIKQLVRPVNNDIVPKAQRLGFNQAEIEAMNQVARGTTAGNAARYLGKLAPTGSVSGVLSAGAGYGAAGPLGAVALPAAGFLAKKIGDMSTKSAVRHLDFLVRSRSPLAQQVAAQLPPQLVAQLPTKSQRILQTLAVAAPPIRQNIGQPVGQPSPQ